MTQTTSKTLNAADVSISADHGWRRLPTAGIVLGVLGLGGSAALASGNVKQFYFSYLVAFLFFLSLGLGGLFFTLVQHLGRAGWSVVVRRLAENAMGTLPLFILLFIPVAVGLHELYHWSHHDTVAGDPILRGKAGYLNPTFFYLRAATYLLLWSGIALFFRRTSTRQDQSRDPELTRRMQVRSGPAILVYALTLSFAAFDWIMSLDPHWYSTIFGIYYFSGCVVGIYATMTLLAAALGQSGVLRGAVTVEHFHDLGKMMFAFVAFWAYIAFSQYFLIWYANIPEETVWFLQRWKGSWREVSILLGLGHFVLPFFFFLPRTIKRNRTAVVLGAAWLLAMHYVDLYWLVMPTLHHDGAHPALLDLTTFVGLGGVFLAALGRLMCTAPLVAIGDPRLAESLTFENQ